ncbi:MBL fold metallo-hydrolase, partial [Escherichia coli]|nr:MBL fold metallo-hydrolase [Escherichia coli]
SNDEAGFIAELLDGQPDAHAYFARMKRQNRDGAKVLGPLPELVEFTAEQIIEQTASNDAVFVDTRGHLAVAEGTVAGALAIPAIAKMANFGAWAFDPEADARQLILFAEDLQAAQQMRDHLMRVGIDAVSGYATSLEGLPAFTPP